MGGMSHMSVGGLRLRFEIAGEGPPVLFLPGMGNGREAWRGQVVALGEAFRCVTYDPRDVGESDLATAPYTIRDLAGDAAALLEALGVARAHVVGWSMGGAVAQELALGWPERVDRLVLIATYPAGDARGAANLHGWALLRRRLEPVDYQRVIAPWVYSPREFDEPDLVERAIAQVLRRPAQPQAAFERQVEATLGHDALDRLPLIAAPTLLLFGTDDALTPLRFAHALRARIPHSDLQTIDGAGHALIWTRAAEVNAALRQFLGGPAP
jgi:pimeloyl-ACP methyl ester carboxylesterase